MFTGIILAVGKIAAIEQRAGDCRLSIAVGKLPMADVNLGDSIAVNGVCLTVVDWDKQYFSADVSNETLSRTTLATLTVGSPVNLELALMPSTRMGGHIVSGHVDGIGKILDKKPDGRSFRFTVETPHAISKYIAEKGSICIDGISLTVNSVGDDRFGVNIVPHTLEYTTLGTMQVGAKVNLEVDLLARYMERLMPGNVSCPSKKDTLTMELLEQSGFLR